MNEFFGVRKFVEFKRDGESRKGVPRGEMDRMGSRIVVTTGTIVTLFGVVSKVIVGSGFGDSLSVCDDCD